MNSIICDAINNHEYLEFSYDGYLRKVQPAAYGVSSAGNDVLRCYQVAGGHVTPGHEWDLCKVSKITSLKATGEHFIGEPPGYKKGDRGMTTIYCEL